jgi:hypothetical protein
VFPVGQDQLIAEFLTFMGFQQPLPKSEEYQLFVLTDDQSDFELNLCIAVIQVRCLSDFYLVNKIEFQVA